MNARTLSLLIFCNLIWSFHPMLGKIALESFTPMQVALLRYGTAAAAYFLFHAFFRARSHEIRSRSLFPTPKERGDRELFFILGFAPFAASPILQLEGLSQAQSIDNAIVVAMEPLMTVVLAWAVLRETLTQKQWLAFFAAISGFLLLSGGDRFLHGDTAGVIPSFVPFVLMLMALWGEAVYSVLGRKLSRDYEPLPLFGIAITIGAAALFAYNLIRGTLPDFGQISLRSVLAVLYLGPLGTTLTYMIWIRVIQSVPVAGAALTLFIQPLVGTLLGVMIRDEAFTWIQSVGALTILAAVGAQSWWEIRSNRR